MQTSKHLSVRAAASSASCFSQQQQGGAASDGKTTQAHDASVEMVKTEEHVETFWVEKEASGQPEPGSIPWCWTPDRFLPTEEKKPSTWLMQDPGREQSLWILTNQETSEAEMLESLKFGNQVKTLHPSYVLRGRRWRRSARKRRPDWAKSCGTFLSDPNVCWWRSERHCAEEESPVSITWRPDSHIHSMELSASCPSGGSILAGKQEGGNMAPALGDGSTFSQSSILSAAPSQLMWKRVTRGLDAKMFLWSCGWGRHSGLDSCVSITAVTALNLNITSKNWSRKLNFKKKKKNTLWSS